MAYNYPPEKLSVYLSDDDGSILTFYGMWEASLFAKHWLPFCKRYNIEPRSPAAYFSESDGHQELCTPKEWSLIKILIDGRDQNAVDNEGKVLPTLVYMAREKRPQHHHNFKAGAMNALLESLNREIVPGLIVRGSVAARYKGIISDKQQPYHHECGLRYVLQQQRCGRDALCFFLDEGMGHKIGFVQYPQNYYNLSKNNIYGNSLHVINEFGWPYVYWHGMCHRREILCGRKFTEDYQEDWNAGIKDKLQESIDETEEKAKSLAACTYEHGMQSNNTCSDDTATQAMERGYLLDFPFKVQRLLVCTWKNQATASNGLPYLWTMGTNPLATLYYVIIPSLALLKGTSLFPEITSPWIAPFVYVFCMKNMYSQWQSFTRAKGGYAPYPREKDVVGQKNNLIVFGVLKNLRKLLGLSKMNFVVSPKVSDEDESKRHEQEIMEFGSSDPEYVIIATISLLNLVCLLGGLSKVMKGGWNVHLDALFPQLILCGMVVFTSIPFYEAMFLRKDKCRIPFPVTLASIGFVMLALPTTIVQGPTRGIGV
uniref:Cellulose synthase-like protein E1 n=1 Tax=Aegilops tauschii TaxID=37682 RepID=R7W8G9_AEGTA